MEKKISKIVANKTAAMLDAFLRVDANSASCCIVHQPKAPKALEKYRRRK